GRVPQYASIVLHVHLALACRNHCAYTGAMSPRASWYHRGRTVGPKRLSGTRPRNERVHAPLPFGEAAYKRLAFCSMVSLIGVGNCRSEEENMPIQKSRKTHTVKIETSTERT